MAIYWSILGQTAKTGQNRPKWPFGHFWHGQKWPNFWSFGHNMVDLNFWSILVGLAVWHRLLGQNGQFLADFGRSQFLAGFGRKFEASLGSRPKPAKNWSVNFAANLSAKLADRFWSQNQPKPTRPAKTGQKLVSIGWFWSDGLNPILGPAPSLGPGPGLTSRAGTSTVQCWIGLN